MSLPDSLNGWTSDEMRLVLELLPAALRFGLLRQVQRAYRDLVPPRQFLAVRTLLTKCMAQCADAPRLLNRADAFMWHLVAHVWAEIHLHDCAPPGLQWLLRSSWPPGHWLHAEGTALKRAGPSGEVHQLRFPSRSGVTLEMCCRDVLPWPGSQHQFAARLTGEPSCKVYCALAQRLQLQPTWCLVWKGHSCCDETGEIVRKAKLCPAFFTTLSEILAEEAGAQPGGTRDGADASWLFRWLWMKLGSEAFLGGNEPDLGADCYIDEFVRRHFATEPAESWQAAEEEGEEEEDPRFNGCLEKRFLVLREKPWMPVKPWPLSSSVLFCSRLNELAAKPDAEELDVDQHLAELLACGVELARHEPPQRNFSYGLGCYYEQSYSGVSALSTHVEAQLRCARARLFAVPIRKQISALHYQVPQLQMWMQDLWSRLTLLEVQGKLPSRFASSFDVDIQVSVQHAAGVAFFMLSLSYDGSYDDEDDANWPQFKTVLSVNFDDVCGRHELYRQHANRDAQGFLQTDLVPTPVYCNPVTDQERQRALAALGFPSDVSPDVLLDACRGTMMLPFLTRLPHRVKPGDPLEWWAWVH